LEDGGAPESFRGLPEQAAAVPLRAVCDMQLEFIQANAAMTPQSFAVQQGVGSFPALATRMPNPQ